MRLGLENVVWTTSQIEWEKHEMQGREQQEGICIVVSEPRTLFGADILNDLGYPDCSEECHEHGTVGQ